MSVLRRPPTMRYLLAAFGPDPAALTAAAERLGRSLAEAGIGPDLGPVDDSTPDLPVVETGYYEAEMGPGLVKRYMTYARPADPSVLVDLKLAAMAIERETAGPGGRRTVNLDPGYVFEGGLVLATGKFSGHRLYLGRGVWGELTLHYHRRAFESLSWTYRDYRRPEVVGLLTRARAALMADPARRAGSSEETPWPEA